jgi:hypothetical protein
MRSATPTGGWKTPEAPNGPTGCGRRPACSTRSVPDGRDLIGEDPEAVLRGYAVLDGSDLVRPVLVAAEHVADSSDDPGEPAP